MPPSLAGWDALESIKRYWQNMEKMMPDSNLALIEVMTRDLQEHGFLDATQDNPLPAVLFVSQMDCERLEEFMAKIYPRTKKSKTVKERVMAKLRILSLMVIKGYRSIRALYRSLTEEDFIKLGFKRKPSYESIREFINDRLGPIGLIELFYILIELIVDYGKKNGIEIGKRIGEDATDIRALKHDPDADYSGYYKEHGYKVDIVFDLDNNALPLALTLLNINANEAECLVPSIEKLTRLGCHPTYIAFDDKYATYSNIGYCGIHGIDTVYKIASNWKYNKKGDLEEIKRRYQKYHRNEDWIVNASLEQMLWYLYEHGDIEYVGAYYRNQSMHEYQSNPEEYVKRCNERSSKVEGMNGYLKTQTNLDSRLPRRGWKAFAMHVVISLLGPVFAAFIRLQHGITQNISNITYIV